MGIFSSNKPHLTTIIDVGSSSIGAATVLMYPNEKPKVLYSIRKEMAFQDNFRFERFVSSMLDTLEKVTQELSHLPVPPHSDRTFLCVFASPWYASQTRILKKTFDKPTKITENFLNDVHAKEIEAFKEREMEIMGKDAVMLEIESIQTKLNGYETSNPFGKEALDFQTAIYFSISPHSIVQSVTEKIRRAFHGKVLHFSSFPFASFITMRDIFPDKNFLLVDISGEVTDISIVRNNILQETVSFPLGKSFLIRKIVSEVGSTYPEAVSQFRMVSNSDLDESVAKKIKKAMEKAGEAWFAECQSVLSPIIDRQEILPHNVFVTADEDVSSWFTDNIQELGNSSFTLASTTFNVKHLNATFLSSFCESETGIERDSFLMVESLFAKRFIT
jgi:hypothetical protein